jgi:hypothetical protein
MGNILLKGGVGVREAQSLINSTAQDAQISQIQTGDIYGLVNEPTEFSQIETNLLPKPQLVIPTILQGGHGLTNLMSVQGARDTSLANARLGMVDTFHF